MSPSRDPVAPLRSAASPRLLCSLLIAIALSPLPHLRPSHRGRSWQRRERGPPMQHGAGGPRSDRGHGYPQCHLPEAVCLGKALERRDIDGHSQWGRADRAEVSSSSALPPRKTFKVRNFEPLLGPRVWNLNSSFWGL